MKAICFLKLRPEYMCRISWVFFCCKNIPILMDTGWLLQLLYVAFFAEAPRGLLNINKEKHAHPYAAFLLPLKGSFLCTCCYFESVNRSARLICAKCKKLHCRKCYLLCTRFEYICLSYNILPKFMFFSPYVDKNINQGVGLSTPL